MNPNRLVIELMNENDDNQLRIGEIIRVRRHQLRWRMKDLAEYADTSSNTIAAIENNEKYSPQWRTVVAILNSMGIKVRFDLDEQLANQIKEGLTK